MDLSSYHILITAGPTQEPIDPVRFLSNQSSGKQGYAIAEVFGAHKAKVTLISGPVALATPPGVTRISVMTALEMHKAVQAALPCDVAICVAAVADWRAKEVAATKMKKHEGQESLTLELVRNPDILADLCKHPLRPSIVVGFAAETDHVIENAKAKYIKKGCDFLLANDVSADIFGKDETHIFAISAAKTEDWGVMNKKMVGEKLVELVTVYLASKATK